jgi:4-deoxy-L-threo-5-hexosulose-uronate ketol-isomerase
MEFRQPVHPDDAKNYDTGKLRKNFLINGLFKPDKINRVYSHIDRIIVAGVFPLTRPVMLDEAFDVYKNLGSEFFLQGRELGIINIGGKGKVTADGEEFILDSHDGLYLGMGIKKVGFESADATEPAKFYCNSAPAHKNYPNVHITNDTVPKVHLGDQQQLNLRTINQYIHPARLQTCQLLMGMTILENGSVWNTMPCHTHERRMEVYFYFDIPEDGVVFHYMGRPDETRHIVVRNNEAVISPSWSIHFGVGTASYSFIWGMVGENKEFGDMDAVEMASLK